MKTIDERVLWDSGSWRFRVVRIGRGDGRTWERGLIAHPGSVVLVPIDGEDVLILRQYRPALEAEIWELPAGTRDWEENWETCAQRELREETGHRAGELIHLGDVWPAPGHTDERMAIYLARGLMPDPLPMDEDEELEVVRRPLAELLAQALDGRLQDAKSVAGVLRAAHHLGRLTDSS